MSGGSLTIGVYAAVPTDRGFVHETIQLSQEPPRSMSIDTAYSVTIDARLNPMRLQTSLWSLAANI
jgi:hypothetical protein